MPRMTRRFHAICRQEFGRLLPVIIPLLFGLLMTDSTSTARADPPQAIPDPRPAHHVVDLTGTLAPNDVAAIDASARRASVHGELMVVVVQSTDGKNPREWTTRLFNQFALDTRRRNRGVLLMAALNDRKAEIVVGNGFPSGITTATDAVMTGVVVNQFKAGNPRNALVLGAQAIADRVVPWGLTPQASSSIPALPSDEHADPENPVSGTPGNEPPIAAWLARFGAFGCLGVALRQILRRRPRKCSRCKVPMGRLCEEEDDKHLESGEVKEEQIGSVDYDIWSCPACGKTLKTRWGAIFTHYSKCGTCRYRTLLIQSRTITPATEYSTGLAELTESCSLCSHQRTHQRIIPRVSRSSGSGGGSSSGRGSSGSW
jgi:uncharacterized protein